jgi:hypothetical protein
LLVERHQSALSTEHDETPVAHDHRPRDTAQRRPAIDRKKSAYGIGQVHHSFQKSRSQNRQLKDI